MFWKLLEYLAANGAIIAVMLVAIFRFWGKERLSQSIKSEYAKGLEDHKSDLKKKNDAFVENLKNEHVGAVEKLKADLQVEAEKRSLKNLKIYEKQFDAVQRIHRKWFNLVQAIRTYVHPSIGPGSPDIGEYRSDFLRTIREFHDARIDARLS